ncbi:LysR family transcriptional regulator [Dysgonomonas macrotermitis]|uniref:DNA-binding transcriptional regulator, LysR family n=1 Tax=Dysgonomonas macrotermitis TaxID=1346286 RepID=A0A1M4X1T4_9BACT|nr:LysR family transcriptional regulator [Dysgonomonas macrotermitis]SHE87458.1 DNA-binding transcriptional regulator, LysR family [Dysgonomonas macrotermitis]
MSNFRLKVFHSVASHLNFTQAAEELFITQPAVTKNIKELETELNARLFDRIKGKVYLTEAGEILLDYTKQIFELDRKLTYQLSSLSDKYSGQLRLGASTTIGQYILPAVLARFNQEYPDIHITLINDNTKKIEALLAAKEIDMGLVEGKSKNSQLKYTPFIKDEIVAIAHTSKPLSEKDEITLDELRSIPVVLREQGSGSLDVIVDKLHEHNISLRDLNIVMHLGSTEGIKSYLRYSDTLGLISINAISKELKNGEYKIIDITDFEVVRTFDFVQLHGQQQSLSDLFMDFASKTITRSNSL